MCKTSKCAGVERISVIKYLGVHEDSEVNWKIHISTLKSKINSVIISFYFLKSMINKQLKRILYFALVQSRIEYGIIIWGNAFSTFLNPIYLQQKHIIRIISDKRRFEHTAPLFKELKILPLRHLFVFKVLKLFFEKSRHNHKNKNVYRNRLRNPDQFVVPKPNNAFFTRTYSFISPRLFNKIPNELKNSSTKSIFLKLLKTWLIRLDSIEDILSIQK